MQIPTTNTALELRFLNTGVLPCEEPGKNGGRLKPIKITYIYYFMLICNTTLQETKRHIYFLYRHTNPPLQIGLNRFTGGLG
jgi:hypothetical protein